MITVYVNHTGYLIEGGGLKIVSSCSAPTEYSEIQVAYVVLAKALRELVDVDIDHEVTVYNSTRVVDELNGIVQAQDAFCEEIRNQVRRNVLPLIGGNVFFRKYNESFVQGKISQAQTEMINVGTPDLPPPRDGRPDVVDRFKQGWLDYEGKRRIK